MQTKNKALAAQFANYKAPSNLLKEKIIMITGAGDGIGKCAAIEFARYGATVILLGRTLAKLEAVYDEIEAHGFAQPAIFPINLESAVESDYQSLYDAINDEFGGLDGILHNAAELGPRTPILNYASEQWLRVFQVNVHAPYLLTKALLSLINPNGSIVFTSTEQAAHGTAYWGAYSASKAAQDNLMQILAEELDGTKNIRSNSIAPGPVRTALRTTAYPAEAPETVPEPESVMQQYLFLMGSDSEGISGARLSIDR